MSTYLSSIIADSEVIIACVWVTHCSHISTKRSSRKVFICSRK